MNKIDQFVLDKNHFSEILWDVYYKRKFRFKDKRKILRILEELSGIDITYTHETFLIFKLGGIESIG